MIQGSRHCCRTMATVEVSSQIPHLSMRPVPQFITSPSPFSCVLYLTQVAATANVVDCSSSPKCSSLNREHCYKTSGTCSGCLAGYTGRCMTKLATDSFYSCSIRSSRFNNLGVIGDSNVICRNASSSAYGAIGSPCTINSDCLYGQCTNNVCTAPILQCPTSILGKSPEHYLN